MSWRGGSRGRFDGGWYGRVGAASAVIALPEAPMTTSGGNLGGFGPTRAVRWPGYGPHEENERARKKRRAMEIAALLAALDEDY